MNNRFAFLLLGVGFLFLVSCQKTKPNTKAAVALSDFAGSWKWQDNTEGDHIFDLELHQIDSIVEGFYCAVKETASGQKVDCHYEAFNFKGIIHGKELTAEIKSQHSGLDGQVKIMRLENGLHWQIINGPGKGSGIDYFCPNDALLFKSDDHQHRKIVRGETYQWEVTDRNYVPELNGKWILTDFFDSTIINKTLYPYFDLSGTYFAVLLDLNRIQQDTLYQMGLIEETVLTTNPISTYRIATSSYLPNSSIRYNPVTDLIEYQINSDPNNPVILNYRYVPDFNLDIFSPEMEDYFNNIISGKYKSVSSDQVITFGPDNQVKGLNGYSTFKVWWMDKPNAPTDFDALMLQSKGSKKQFFLHWKFVDENLVLYNLEKIVDPKSKAISYTPGEVYMILENMGEVFF